MSKKNKTLQTEESQVNNESSKVEVKKEEKVKSGKADKKVKKEKKHVIAKKTKETVSELKKVTWPTFPEVVKRTGVVLVVVIIFAVILFGLDSLFGFLFSLLNKR